VTRNLITITKRRRADLTLSSSLTRKSPERTGLSFLYLIVLEEKMIPLKIKKLYKIHLSDRCVEKFRVYQVLDNNFNLNTIILCLLAHFNSGDPWRGQRNKEDDDEYERTFLCTFSSLVS